jgi:hypothetical protein
MLRENKETDQDWVKVEIDPTAVSGQNGQFLHFFDVISIVWRTGI